MNVKDSYNIWAGSYDTDQNKTRDLEAIALREMLDGIQVSSCLETGCGTGKNTTWLSEISRDVLAVDFSGKMLEIAAAKIGRKNVSFLKADISKPWTFTKQKFGLISFSLVLEHIEKPDTVFSHMETKLEQGSLVYIGELHPFRQYRGSKARFDTADGIHVLKCYTHHISDFTESARRYGLRLLKLREFFDEGEDRETGIPRILAMLFMKED